MNKVTFLLLILVSSVAMAQQTTPKGAWLEKWNNSKNYLLEIAQAMPEQYFEYKPTDRQMSFKEQLLHIQKNMEWLGATYFGKEESEISTLDNEKQRILKNIEYSFDTVAIAIQSTPKEDFSEIVDFFAGQKSKLQMLNLLQDHVTHHRGQLLVYLNLKNIEPPKYSGW